MKAVLSTLVLLASLSSFATLSEDHRVLCEEASKSYPNVFANTKVCVRETQVEFDDTRTSIQFADCENGLLVSLYLENGEISEGSSGADDICE